MINNITSTSPFLTIQFSTGPYVQQTGNMDTANLRYDVQQQCLKIHNGYSYEPFGNMVSIGTTSLLDDVLNWACNKMQEEQRFQERLDKYPSLKKAYEQFQIIDQLTVEYDKNK